ARHERGAGARGDPAPGGRGAGHLRAQRGGAGRDDRRARLRRRHAGAGRGRGCRDRAVRARRVRGGPRAGARGQRPAPRSARPLRPARVHRPEPAVPLRAVRVVPQPSPARHGAPRLGPALRAAGLDVRLRARPCPRVGGRARPHPRPHRPRGRPARDRDRRAGPPLGDHAGVPRHPSRHTGRQPGRRPPPGRDTVNQPTRPLPPDLPAHVRPYIDGALGGSADGATFDVLDPVTNESYTRAAAGKAADVDAAVAAARKAFTDGPWPRMLPRERSRVLHRIADIVESRDARLAELESFDSGLPITQALGQARRAAENFRFFADLVVAQTDDAFKVPGRQLNYVNRKPIGVAGLITPWNTPFMLESWKLAPALATGNTVVLKPAEFTPLSASLWAGIFEEAGLPAGVFNLVNGLGEEAGDALVKHPDVPLISFTGESATGQLIFANAAPHLKGLSMELGGKSPAIVFADADLEAAIDATIFGVFSLNGERCTAGSRILVERAVYDEFVERYAAQAARVKVGYPHDPATEVGALVHPEHLAKVMEYVELGKGEGRLVAGGGRPDG